MAHHTHRLLSASARTILAGGAIIMCLFSTVPAGVLFVTIEDFDDGQVTLDSYPGEDADPNGWVLDPGQGHNGSPYALRLTGNTWKTEAVGPFLLDTLARWSVSAKILQPGELQGFGIADSAHTLLFAFGGSEEADPSVWVTVHQGAFAAGVWNTYTLPVAEEWLTRFGYLPAITRLIFINDRDTDPSAEILFDDILEVTDDQPQPPHVAASYTIGAAGWNPDGTRSVEVHFESSVIDPDGGPHTYFWHFGDGLSSALPDPVHTYTVSDDHRYTVLLEVRDTTNRWGRAVCSVVVDSGAGTLPLTLNFVGDVMLARGYEAPGGIIPTLGVEAIFAPTRSILGEAADLTVANMECPLTQSGTPHPTKPIVFRGSPANAAGLTYAGIDVVTVANNHILDYGLPGLEETRSVLAARGIASSGAGADVYEAERPLFLSRAGLGIAFLASSDRTGQYNNYQPFLNAGEGKPGFAELTPFRLSRSIRDVRELADAIVVELHAGSEYSIAPDNEGEHFRAAPAPTAEEREARRGAIDAGADLVICHHPHILHGVEAYGGRLIAHSLGNFVFDLGYAETFPSAVLSCKLDTNGFREFRLTPVFIDDFIPRRATGELGLHILEDLVMKSRALGTTVTIQRDSVVADVVLDTTLLIPRDRPRSLAAVLRQEGSAWISEPAPLAVPGSLRGITSLLPAGSWSYRLGHDLVWFGSFEEEGATPWALDEGDERIDSTVARTGVRSLRQRRSAGTTEITTRLDRRTPAADGTLDYSVYGWIRTSGGRNVRIRAALFASRTGGSEIGSAEPPVMLQGTNGWTFVYGNTQTAVPASFADFELRSSGPAAGTGEVWLDDTGIIEWSEWRAWNPAETFPVPTNIRWIQFRSPLSVPTVQASLLERTFRDVTTPAHIDVILHEGWNLVSNPLALPESLSVVTSLFPSAASGAAFVFSTASGYHPVAHLTPGHGYWAKFPVPEVRRLEGPPLYAETLQVARGWNLIGSVSTAMDTSAALWVPAGLRSSLFYGYAPGYFPVEQILPGGAVWVKAAADGIVLLQSGAPSGSNIADRESREEILSAIVLTDARGSSHTLYYTASPGAPFGDQEMFQVPPPPPEGAPDLRFADGTLLATAQQDGSVHPILCSGLAYPLTVRWDDRSGGRARLATPAADRILSGSGTWMVHADPGAFALHLPAVAPPGSFSVTPFYPNPFNSAAAARVDIPVHSSVHIVLFDILGRNVETLLEEHRPPGTISLRVEGSGKASGVYFCRVTAHPLNGGPAFSAVRKLMLLR